MDFIHHYILRRRIRNLDAFLTFANCYPLIAKSGSVIKSCLIVKCCNFCVYSKGTFCNSNTIELYFFVASIRDLKSFKTSSNYYSFETQ